MEVDRVAWTLAVPLPARFRLIRWIHGFIDSAASFGQSITTASRSAVNREPGSAHRVVARTGLPHFGQLAAPRCSPKTSTVPAATMVVGVG